VGSDAGAVACGGGAGAAGLPTATLLIVAAYVVLARSRDLGSRRRWLSHIYGLFLRDSWRACLERRCRPDFLEAAASRHKRKPQSKARLLH
jgi:hypothetical protein